MWFDEDAAMERLEEVGAVRRFNLETDGKTIFRLDDLAVFAKVHENGLFLALDIEDIVSR